MFAGSFGFTYIDEFAFAEGQNFPGGAQATAVSDGDTLTLTRDRFGQVPLHYGWARDLMLVFGTRLRHVLDLGAVPNTVRWVPPGRRLVFADNQLAEVDALAPEPDLTPSGLTLEEAAPTVHDLATEAINRSMVNADSPAVLVSGGIDSSVVAAVLTRSFPNIPAYTAVFDPDAIDRKYSRLLCDELGIELTEVIVPPPTPDDLAKMIELIELPFKAQIELAWPCYWLAERMRADGIKTMFSGEASDELWGSYARSFFVARRSVDWHHTRWHDFLDQHRKNFPRMWKLFAAYGIETRTPFCDEALVRFALPLIRDAVYDFPPVWTKVGKRCKEKGVLRLAFRDAVPLKIVNRDKLAFQSGAGIPKAVRAVLAEPERFYRAEFRNQFGAVKL